jgi:uncharacterized protein (TIGR00645 family)
MDIVLRPLAKGIRWALVPIQLVIFGALLLVAVRLVANFVEFALHMRELTDAHLILSALSLIDLALVVNLLITVIGGGVDSLTATLGDGSEKPPWFADAQSDGIKLRLMAAMVAISAIEILKDFMHVSDLTDRQLIWAVGIHLALVASAVFLAMTERLHAVGRGRT